MRSLRSSLTECEYDRFLYDLDTVRGISIWQRKDDRTATSRQRVFSEDRAAMHKADSGLRRQDSHMQADSGLRTGPRPSDD